MERSTILNGKIHELNSHFPLLFWHNQRVTIPWYIKSHEKNHHCHWLVRAPGRPHAATGGCTKGARDLGTTRREISHIETMGIYQEKCHGKWLIYHGKFQGKWGFTKNWQKWWFNPSRIEIYYRNNGRGHNGIELDMILHDGMSQVSSVLFWVTRGYPLLLDQPVRKHCRRIQTCWKLPTEPLLFIGIHSVRLWVCPIQSLVQPLKKKTWDSFELLNWWP